MSEESIDVSQDAADFITAISEYVEPQFLGEYTPLYSTSETMSGLKFEESSSMMNFDVDCGFTIDGKEISALSVKIKENQDGLFEVINDNLSKLSDLRELIILLDRYPQMVDLEGLSSLQYLRVHNASDEPLDLPDSVSYLENLIVFNIRGPVQNFPQDLKLISGIQRIIIKDTQSPQFPDLQGLDRLVWLEIGGEFTEIEESFSDLPNLVILELVANKLTSLPESIGKLTNLQHLSIEAQQLSALPKSFAKLKLTDLYLWSLDCESIPEEICEISTLSHFWFKDNSRVVGTLYSIPDCIGDLQELVDLQINGHQIRELPTSVGNLQKLEVLNLGINELTSLPESLFTIKSLKRLELYYNKFSSFPDYLTGIPKLEYLDLSDNQLITLPDSIGDLPLLDELDLMGNPIESLPEGFRRLHPFQFSTFMVTLKTPPDDLDPETKDWLEKMVKYSERNPEKMILDISLFDDENQLEEDEDEELLLENDE